MNVISMVAPLAGGALIGLSASLFLLSEGKITGISGILGAILRRATADRDVRIAFVVGLVVAGLAARLAAPWVFGSPAGENAVLLVLAGLLVGFGSRLGNGCTSGHGVCGLSRLSNRSLVATLTFIAAGMATVFSTRHVIGGSP